MLRRSREAHHATDKRVIATVGIPAALREQLVETMRRPLAPTSRHIEAQCSQTRRRHRDQQRGLALAARGEIGEPALTSSWPGKLAGTSFMH
jgi:hypothetical protein